MVAGLKFLSKKSFNPQNLNNQKSVWEREEQSKRERDRFKQREKQLRIERDHEELAKARDGTSGGQKAALSFMYNAPPGMERKKNSDDDDYNYYGNGGGGDKFNRNSEKVTKEREGGISLERKPGDDDAAAAFRRLFAETATSTATKNIDNDSQLDTMEEHDTTAASSLIISGSTAEADNSIKASARALTQLEKAVGRKNHSSSLTYEEQISRFPQLKNAPRVLKRRGNGDGDEDGAVDTNLNFKPLGAQIRNVRCLVCKVWGHSKGDRECKLSGWDPFATKPLDACMPTGSSNTREAGKDSVAANTIVSAKPNDQSYKRKYGKERDSNTDEDSEIYRRRRHRHKRKKSKRRHREESSSRRRSRMHRDRDYERKERKSRRKKHKGHHGDRHSDDYSSYDTYSEDSKSSQNDSHRGRRYISRRNGRSKHQRRIEVSRSRSRGGRSLSGSRENYRQRNQSFDSSNVGF